MGGVWWCWHMRAQPRTPSLQGVRWFEHLRAQPTTQQVQGVWWFEHLRAQPSTLQVQGVWWIEHMQARSTTLQLQDLSWQGQPEGDQFEELEEDLEIEGTKSQVDQESQASKIERKVSLQRNLEM